MVDHCENLLCSKKNFTLLPLEKIPTIRALDFNSGETWYYESQS
jgi:hypothetical protein